MPRKKRDPAENRTAFLSVTLRPDDRERVTRAAKKAYTSDSNWAAALLVAELDRLDRRRRKKKGGDG